MEIKVLPPLPYEEPIKKEVNDIVVIEEERIDSEPEISDDTKSADEDEKGQGTLF